ncbi:MAG TPA: thiamine-phosphate kinase [Gemmatimonadales bacterium]|jgi:thiamine-monophosphate kinase
MSDLALGPGREFDRIRGILKRLGPAARDIGDDCAIIPEGGGRLVVSVDLSIEDVHFRREWLSLEEIGWRAAAASLSDLAAEGAEPVGLLASVGLPRQAGDEELLELMTGIGAAARSVGGAVLGGDLSASRCWLVDIAVIGRAEHPVTRAGAAPGDGVWVTGTLGVARAALQVWEGGGTPLQEAREAFARPAPRIAAGRALARAGARAMIDLSDGLAGDAGHLAAASGVSLEIDLGLLPLAPSVTSAAAAAGIPAAEFAALGGEDYELLAALPPAFAEEARARFTRETGVALTRIGTAVAGSGTRLLLNGQPRRLSGYDHFA